MRILLLLIVGAWAISAFVASIIYMTGTGQDEDFQRLGQTVFRNDRSFQDMLEVGRAREADLHTRGRWLLSTSVLLAIAMLAGWVACRRKGARAPWNGLPSGAIVLLLVLTIFSSSVWYNMNTQKRGLSSLWRSGGTTRGRPAEMDTQARAIRAGAATATVLFALLVIPASVGVWRNRSGDGSELS
jgi:hypothetical protein